MKPTGFSLAPAFFAQPCYASVAEDVSEIVIRAREGGVAGTTALPELQSAARSDLAAENELGALAEDGVAKPSGPDAALKLWRTPRRLANVDAMLNLADLLRSQGKPDEPCKPR